MIRPFVLVLTLALTLQLQSFPAWGQDANTVDIRVKQAITWIGEAKKRLSNAQDQSLKDKEKAERLAATALKNAMTATAKSDAESALRAMTDSEQSTATVERLTAELKKATVGALRLQAGEVVPGSSLIISGASMKKMQADADKAKANAKVLLENAHTVALRALDSKGADNALTVAQDASGAMREAESAAETADQMQKSVDQILQMSLYLQIETSRSTAKQEPADLRAIKDSTTAMITAIKDDSAASLATSEAQAKHAIDAANNRTWEATSILDRPYNKARQAEEKHLLSAVSKHPDAASLVGSPGVQFFGSSTDSVVSLKLAMTSLGRATDVTLSAPASKTAQRSDLATLDGLSKAFSVQLSKRALGLFSEKENSAFYLYGAAAKIGSQASDYFDEQTLAKTSKTNMPSSFSIFGGLAPGDLDRLLLAKFEYQNSFSDQAGSTACPLATVTTPSKCVTGSFGAPKHEHQRLFSIEARFVGDTNTISAAPILTFDAATKIKGVSIPVYFIPPATSGTGAAQLVGGIEFGWRSDTGTSAGLFVGAPFKILGD